MAYELTDDENIIKEVNVSESLIDLKALQVEIDNLTEEIKGMPDEIMMPSGKIEMMAELEAKQAKLEELSKIK